MKIYWKHLHHPIINEGYLISNTGMIRSEHCCEDESYGANYHATNGYDYAKMVVKESKRYNDNPIRLFPIDEIIGYAFIPVPEDLIDKPKIINHINIDNRLLSAIKNKRIWVTVSDKFFKTGIYRSYKTNIGKKEVHEMCKMLIKYNMDVNKVIGEMASKGIYVSKSCVKHIKYKCNWINVSDEYF